MGEVTKIKSDEAVPQKREVLGGDAEAKRDANEVELQNKVKAMVGDKFGGDFRAAFAHYDGDKDGAINKAELEQLLADAKIGNGFTRSAWASGIIKKMDGGGDSKIQFSEFESAIAAGR